MDGPLYGSAYEPKDWDVFDSDIHNDHSDEVAHQNASCDESVEDEVGHMCSHLYGRHVYHINLYTNKIHEKEENSQQINSSDTVR
jgi:hypothetical protein